MDVTAHACAATAHGVLNLGVLLLEPLLTISGMPVLGSNTVILVRKVEKLAKQIAKAGR